MTKFKDKIVKALTPDNTEEIKPNLFVQTRRNNHYRVVTPIAWDGKIRWREQLRSVFSIRFVITIGIVLFIVWAYNHDVKELLDFYNEFNSDQIAFCQDILFHNNSTVLENQPGYFGEFNDPEDWSGLVAG